MAYCVGKCVAFRERASRSRPLCCDRFQGSLAPFYVFHTLAQDSTYRVRRLLLYGEAEYIADYC